MASNQSSIDLVKPSPVGGNGLFAFKDVEQGESLVMTARPLVVALDSTRLKDTCANCFEWTTEHFQPHNIDEYKLPGLKTCVGCKTMRYCSKDCQADSWKREHKHFCKLLGKLQQKGSLPNAARAVLRMLNIMQSPRAQHLVEMNSHLNEITRNGGERAETLLVMSTGIHEYSGTTLGVEIVQELFARVLTNSLTVYTSTFDPMGICVDPLFAKANHSCDPNCVAIWDGPKLQFRSVKPIKKGEELFISYIDPSQPYNRRKRELEDKFYFTCKCSKCLLKWSGPNDKFVQEPKPEKGCGSHVHGAECREDITKSVMQEMLNEDRNDPDNMGACPNHLKDLKWVQKLAYTSLQAANRPGEENDMDVLTAGLQVCIKTKIWPEDRQPVPMIRHSAFTKFLVIAKRRPEYYCKAFSQGLKLYFDSWPVVHPQPSHPMRVVLSWTLAHLALCLAAETAKGMKGNMGNEDLDYGVIIWGFLMETYSNVEKSHGKDHRFSANVKRKVDEVRTDMTRGDPSKVVWAEKQITQQWKHLRRIANAASVNSFLKDNR